MTYEKPRFGGVFLLGAGISMAGFEVPWQAGICELAEAQGVALWIFRFETRLRMRCKNRSEREQSFSDCGGSTSRYGVADSDARTGTHGSLAMQHPGPPHVGAKIPAEG
ncbi:hypothetical protein [Xanthomonas campestris]|uniref:hypothetical protein n=1 Tax=Xanthomonas campestris TaxID=339 RepID=UPI001E529C4B|nr:hypothetical protein [Xanthomonas campestris]MCC5074215.1 hypothetical protein [Xanthomonas campestris pv. plantaginis]